MPSFNSSPWILGAPQRGFAATIVLTRAAISALMGGRPTRGRPENVLQCSRKRRRCHRRTVSGVTIRRGCLHPAQTLASQTQKRRSILRSLGRVAALVYTSSCWRKARFSRASWRWPPQSDREESQQVEQQGDHRAEILSASTPTDQPLAGRSEFWRRTPSPSGDLGIVRAASLQDPPTDSAVYRGRPPQRRRKSPIPPPRGIPGPGGGL